jgi:agmatinase
MSYNNFMNLPKEFRNKKTSKICILPLIYKGKVTVGSGAFKGAKEIIKASRELEYFDCDLNNEAYTQGIYTTKEFNFFKIKEYSVLLQDMLDKISPEIINFSFPIILGSDHFTTYPTVLAFEKKCEDFGVIILDAHSDLREPWGKDTWHHACVSRYISKNHKTLIAGVRSQDFYEKEYLKTKEGKNLSIVYARELHKSFLYFKKKLKNLPKNIFLSIDVDFFDPSILKNTNTPEPGGFTWNQTLQILEIIFKNKNVIGVDIVEFAPKGPEWNYISESYMLSKLVYKLCSYKFL